MLSNWAVLTVLPLSAALGWVPPAYVDPGTGGMLFQVLAVLFAFFSGIILFFSRQIKTTAARVRRYLGERWGG
jgi:hypothetical protein